MLDSVPTLRRRLILTLLVAAATGLSATAAAMPSLPGDRSFSTWVQSYQTPWLDDAMRAASRYGGIAPMLALLAGGGLVLLLRAGRRCVAPLPLVAASTLIVLPLKALVDRPRPTADLVVVLAKESGNGFPSGHAFHAFMVLGALFYLADRLVGPSRWAVIGARALFTFGIAVVGVSRVYLGVHWASDVVGAYLLAAVTLAAIIAGTQGLAERLGTPRGFC